MMFANNGEREPPCGTPTRVGLTCPFSLPSYSHGSTSIPGGRLLRESDFHPIALHRLSAVSTSTSRPAGPCFPSAILHWKPPTTMTSADFCTLPIDIAAHGALGTTPVLEMQVSAGQPPIFLPATAAFTLNSPSVGFAFLAKLTRILGLIRDFYTTARGFAVPLPSDPTSR